MKKGSHQSKESIEKIKIARARQIMLPCSEETKIKISNSERGKVVSNETKQKIKEKRKNQIIIHSEETKKKISKSHTGLKYPPHTKEWKEEHIKRLIGKPSRNKGKIQSKEARRKNSQTHIELIKAGKIVVSKNGYGIRSYYQSPLQGQVCFRSTYELAYAKYLDSINEPWYYESKIFDLGSTTYTPDFYLPDFEKYVEIKGWMNQKAKIKIEKFKDLYDFNFEILYRNDLQKLGVEI